MIIATVKLERFYIKQNGFVDPNEDEINQEVTLQSTSTLEEAMDCHFSNKGQNNLQQRMTFYCVPIPGESEWVKNVMLISKNI